MTYCLVSIGLGLVGTWVAWHLSGRVSVTSGFAVGWFASLINYLITKGVHP